MHLFGFHVPRPDLVIVEIDVHRTVHEILNRARSVHDGIEDFLLSQRVLV